MKIAVFSSASNIISKENLKLAQNIGEYLAEKKVSVLTGGCVGLPAVVAERAFHTGAETVAYYPDVSEKELLKNIKIHNNDIALHYSEKKFFNGFTNRSIRMIENADAAIVFNGRFGTLSEFSVAIEEGLQVGVIEGTGGITDEIKNLGTVVSRDFKNEVIFGKDYKLVIDELIEKIKNR
ncbi:MAG: hypothetical protein ACPGTS_01620 [Minisyncoccia bacterium]